MKRRSDLSAPRQGRLDVQYDPDAFGQLSETIARTFGTARFLIIQTVVVGAWIALNIVMVRLRWDPYPFILLNLAFSTQAAYAAPLILLAQNRQEHRDRHQAELDRDVAARTQADTEFLAREIAGVRRALAEVPTSDELDGQLTRLTDAVERLTERLELLEPPDRGSS